LTARISLTETEACADCGIETDFVSILKGIREGFFGAINADGHAIDLMCLDAGRV
jgi:hypothetical protein